MQLIPRTWTLPETIVARLGSEAGRQRAMCTDGHLLLVLHAVPKPGDADRAARLFWRDAAGAWHSDAHGNGPRGLTIHLDEFAAAIDKLEERLQKADAARDYFAVLQGISPLQRSARNLLRALQEARDEVEDRELILARDRAVSLERAAELLHADAVHGLDYTIARQGEQLAAASHDLARAGHRLNVLAAVFLPLTALASLFGMQLQTGLETWRAPIPFLVVLVVGLIIGAIVRSGLKPPQAEAPRKHG